MRAVEAIDGAVRIGARPTPTPGPDDLLVKVWAAGLNGADMLQVAGNYPPPPGASDVPGLELAGEVVATGERCSRFRMGDSVMAVVQGGAQAEFCLVHERLALPVPTGVPWPQAGAFPEVFTTAHDALFSQAGLGVGERVLVHGAAGGVGTAATQLAIAAGAQVTAVARANHGRLEEMGAQTASPDDFADGGPYDVILELVGAPNWAANMQSVADDGRIVVIGVQAGSRVTTDLFDLMKRRVRVFASTLRARSLEARASLAREVERHALPLLAQGRVSAPLAAEVALDDVAAAYDRFRQPGKFGKVVLTA